MAQKVYLSFEYFWKKNKSRNIETQLINGLLLDWIP